MQKIAFRQFLLICVILLLPSTGCAAQQMGLDHEARKIVAGVVVAGMAYRTAYSVVYKALDPINLEKVLVSGYAMWRSYPTKTNFVLGFINDRGFSSALLAGVCAAAAARSGSLSQLSVNDVIKPAAWGFGTLFALHIPFWSRIVWCRYQEKKIWEKVAQTESSFGKNRVEKFDNEGRNQANEWAVKGDEAIDWERCVIGYAHKAVVGGLPLYVLYQRYNNRG